jgi:predicted transposase YdaD
MPFVSTIRKLYMEDAKEEGRKEGRKDGRKEGKAQSILAVLRARFGRVPGALSDRLLRVKDLKRLDALVKLATTCQTLDDLSTHLAE